MANLYMDLFESCPLVAPPTAAGVHPLPDSLMAMNRTLSAFVHRTGTGNTSRFASQGVTPGALSERQLELAVDVEATAARRNIASVFRSLEQVQNKLFIGAAVRFNPIGQTNDYMDRPLIGINSRIHTAIGTSSTLDWFSNSCVMLRSSGAVSVGDSISDENVFPVNTHKYVEAVFDPSDGGVEVYVDDALVVSGVLPFDDISAIGFLAAFGNESVDKGYMLEVDNIYINDDTGDHFNGRMGPISVQWAPLKSEDSVTWIPEGAPNNITAVNKNNLSTDSFVRSPSQNDQADLYEIDTDVIDPNKVILGVVSAPYFRKTDIGARNLAAVATDGVNKVERTFTDASLDFAGSTTPLLMHQAPDGGAWDLTKLGNCKFGYEVKA